MKRGQPIPRDWLGKKWKQRKSIEHVEVQSSKVFDEAIDRSVGVKLDHIDSNVEQTRERPGA
jgi:hypothetical protein